MNQQEQSKVDENLMTMMRAYISSYSKFFLEIEEFPAITTIKAVSNYSSDLCILTKTIIITETERASQMRMLHDISW